MLKTNLNITVSGGGAFGRWLGHEHGALMNGISGLIKEAQDSKRAHHLQNKVQITQQDMCRIAHHSNPISSFSSYPALCY